MRESRFTQEQIIGFIKQAEAGMPVKELCRKGGFSDASFYKWRSKYGGMDVLDARRLRELEVENHGPSFRRKTCCPQRPESSAGEGVERT